MVLSPFRVAVTCPVPIRASICASIGRPDLVYYVQLSQPPRSSEQARRPVLACPSPRLLPWRISVAKYSITYEKQGLLHKYNQEENNERESFFNP